MAEHDDTTGSAKQELREKDVVGSCKLDVADPTVLLAPEVLGNEMVKILAGRKRKEFTLHKKLICARSDFFSSSLNQNLLAGQENEMYLPEDNPSWFAYVVDDLYRGMLPRLQVGEKGSEFGRYASLYSLAEKYGMNRLMNNIMNAIYKSFEARELPGFDIPVLNWVYCHTSESSRLRRDCAASVAMTMRISVAEDSEWVDWGVDFISSGNSKLHEPYTILEQA